MRQLPIQTFIYSFVDFVSSGHFQDHENKLPPYDDRTEIHANTYCVIAYAFPINLFGHRVYTLWSATTDSLNVKQFRIDVGTSSISCRRIDALS